MSDETKHVFVGLVEVHSPTLWFLIFLNIIFAITSILGNVIILAALKKQSSLHPPSKILLSFLAITDLCAGLISLPIFITLLMAFQYKIEDIVTFTTELTSYISTALCLSSLFTLAAISVDRFLALFLGIRYRQVVTLRRTAIIVVCSWTVIAGCIITVNWIDILTVLLTYVTATVLLFLMVSICCYTMIYQKLLQHQAQVQENLHQGEPNGHEPLNIARYRKTVSSTLWIQFSLVACYLPFGVTLVLLMVHGHTTSNLISAWVFSKTVVNFNSTLNPILYCWKITEVRRAAIGIIRGVWCG